MARFFSIVAPPLSLDDLDSWAALDSLPASLDSQLWNSAGLWGLEAEDFARCAQSLAGCVIVSLGGSLRAASSAALLSSAVSLLGMEGRASSGDALEGLRKRPLRAGGEARTGGSCLGVGVLYIEAGGAAGTGSELSLLLTAALGGSGDSAGTGGLSLGFVRLLTLGSEGQGGADTPACSAGTLALGFKGWGWQEGRGQGAGPALWQEAARPCPGWASAALPPAQGWEHHDKPSISWKEKEARKRAWL